MYFWIVLLFFNILTGSVWAEDCPPVGLAQFIAQKPNHVFAKGCGSKNKTDLEISEQLYFPKAVDRRLSAVDCGVSTILELSVARNGEPARQARNLIIADTQAAGELIKYLTLQRAALVAEKGRLLPQSSGPRLRAIDAQDAAYVEAIEVVYAGLFGGGGPEMRDLADRLARSPELIPSQRESLFSAALGKTYGDLTRQQNLLGEAKKLNPEAYPDALKKSLTKDLSLKNEIRDDLPGAEDMLEAMTCQLDKEYGFRAEAQERKRDAVIGTLSAIVPAGEMYLMAKVGLNAVGKGAAWLKTLRYAKFAVRSAAGVQAYQDAVNSCASLYPAVKNKSGNTCDNSDVKAFTVKDLSQHSCLQSGILAALQLTPTAAAEVARSLKKREDYLRLASVESRASTVLNFSAKDYQNVNNYLSDKDVAKRYRQLKAQNDPLISYLESAGAKDQNGKITFSPVDAIKSADTQLTAVVEAGRIAKKDTLSLARIYKDKNGTIVGKTIHDEVTGDLVPFKDLLDEHDYWKLIADGKFPIAEAGDRGTFAEIQYGPGFLHDTFHNAGFSDNLDQMVALKNIAPQMAKLGPVEMAKVSERMKYLSEFGATYPKESQKAVSQYVSDLKKTLGTDPEKILTYQDYTFLLSSKSDKDLLKLAASTDTLPKLKGNGGLSADSLSPRNVQEKDIFSPLTGPFTRSDGLFKYAAEKGKIPDREAFVEGIAERLTTADHLKNVTPQSMAQDLLSGDKNSPIMKLLCKSGAITNVNPVTCK